MSSIFQGKPVPIRIIMGDEKSYPPSPKTWHSGPEGGLSSKVITDLGMHINLLLASWGVKKCKKINRFREGNWIFWPKCERICVKFSDFLVNMLIFEALHCSWLKNKYHIWTGEVLTIPKHSLLLSEVNKLSKNGSFTFASLNKNTQFSKSER